MNIPVFLSLLFAGIVLAKILGFIAISWWVILLGMILTTVGIAVVIGIIGFLLIYATHDL